MNMSKSKMTAKKPTFPKRVPEPKEMGREEMKVFYVVMYNCKYN